MDKDYVISLKKTVICPHCQGSIAMNVGLEASSQQTTLTLQPADTNVSALTALAASMDYKKVIIAVRGEGTREVMRECLEAAQFEVIEAASSEELFSAVGTYLPGTLLVDFDTCTLEWVHRIRTKMILIVVSSGYGLSRGYSPVHASLLGADDYIERPSLRQELVEKVKFHLNRRYGYLPSSSDSCSIATSEEETTQTVEAIQPAILPYDPTTEVTPPLTEEGGLSRVSEETGTIEGDVSEEVVSPSAWDDAGERDVPSAEVSTWREDRDVSAPSWNVVQTPVVPLEDPLLSEEPVTSEETFWRQEESATPPPSVETVEPIQTASWEEEATDSAVTVETPVLPLEEVRDDEAPMMDETAQGQEGGITAGVVEEIEPVETSAYGWRDAAATDQMEGVPEAPLVEDTIFSEERTPDVWVSEEDRIATPSIPFEEEVVSKEPFHYEDRLRRDETVESSIGEVQTEEAVAPVETGGYEYRDEAVIDQRDAVTETLPSEDTVIAEEQTPDVLVSGYDEYRVAPLTMPFGETVIPEEPPQYEDAPRRDEVVESPVERLQTEEAVALVETSGAFGEGGTVVLDRAQDVAEAPVIEEDRIYEPSREPLTAPPLEPLSEVPETILPAESSPAVQFSEWLNPPVTPPLEAPVIPPKELEMAKRLARIIVSDIVLYNESKVIEGIRNGTFYTLLKEDIDEGRNHYESRVTPEIQQQGDYLMEAFEAYIQRKKASLSEGK